VSTGTDPAARVRRFTATVTVDAQGRTHVPVPFDPDDAWGPKPRHLVSGTLAGCRLRGAVDAAGDGYEIVLGPAWTRDAHVGAGAGTGAEVEVTLAPEGPQRHDLAPDLAAALEAEPEAAAFFDSLAQFYRKAYLRWIDATKRRPEQRPVRIAEVVRLLREHQKERPKR
jgi:bacteriocin resistance YdeI/OmpD-like protein